MAALGALVLVPVVVLGLLGLLEVLEVLAAGVARDLLGGGARASVCARVVAGGGGLEDRAALARGGEACCLSSTVTGGGGGGALGGKVTRRVSCTRAAVNRILTTPLDFITLPGGVAIRVALGAIKIRTEPAAWLLLPAMALQLTVGVTTALGVSSWAKACRTREASPLGCAGAAAPARQFACC
jgi:hypothetical protein